jgi:uncharacterized phage protein gp47/JayE
VRITPGAQLDPAAIDKTGSTLNILAACSSAMAEECESRSQSRFAAQLVASARGEDLDRLILERSKGELPRKGASAATIDLYLTRSSAALTGSVPAGTEILAGGQTWTTDETVVFILGGNSQIPVSATCAALGDVGNGVEPNIQAFKGSPPSWDPGMVVESYQVASAGGADRETDEAYAARYALWDAGLDRNLDFLAAGALSVPGVAAATAIEDLDTDGNPVGTATVYIGDAYGRATDGLLDRVRVASRGFRLLGQHVQIFRTLPTFVSFTLVFGVLDTYSVDQVREEARAAVVAYVNSLAPGAPLLRASIAAVLRSVPGVVLLVNVPFGCTVPAADTFAASVSTIFRTRSDLIGFG